MTRKGFEARIWELVTGQATLERIAWAMLSARAALKSEYEKLHKTVLAIVREDAVCRRLMTAPSVGPLVAITYKSAMDDPNRIAKSKAAGALFGLTPKKYQSGEKDVTGGITRAGDEMVRTALYEAANVLLSRITRFSKLKRWGNGCCQVARLEARESRPGAQDRSDPAPYVGRRHNLPMDCSGADCGTGLIREQHETQVGLTQALLPEGPVAGTVDAVKPLHAQWPSSDGPREFR